MKTIAVPLDLFESLLAQLRTLTGADSLAEIVEHREDAARAWREGKLLVYAHRQAERQGAEPAEIPTRHQHR